MEGRDTNASEVIRSGIAALRSAIEEGEASGYVQDFDFDAHLKELKAKHRGNEE
ncbi:MAG: type II toxin-antitoxin system ParD family antitoxin [Bacteroidales bacterium]|nr:type II toxin-antitoxin system ParD family antitoxin [Bacteroidales bacterium]